MKIGFFADCWEPQINGVIVSMKNLETALGPFGHRVYKFVPAIAKERHNTPDIFRQFAVKYPFQTEFFVSSPFCGKALRRARAQTLDLIHGHTEFSMGLAAASVAHKLQIPFVFTLHTLWMYYRHYLFWGLLPLSMLISVMRRFYLKPDYFIAPSTKIRRYLEHEFGIQAHIEVIPSGLDLERFYKFSPTKQERDGFRRMYGIGKDDTVMIFVGRIGREKSVDVIIRALPVLLKKHPLLKLLLVGGGPEKEDLKKLAESLGVARAVIFTGYLFRDVLPLAYKSADFYVIASTTESQGLVTAEAMASALPIIARDDIAHLDSLGTRENGIIFKTDSDFAGAVNTLLENPGLVRTLKEKSRERSRVFTLSRFGERMDEFYRWAVEDFSHRKRK